jgi:hypothetical protein
MAKSPEFSIQPADEPGEITGQYFILHLPKPTSNLDLINLPKISSLLYVNDSYMIVNDFSDKNDDGHTFMLFRISNKDALEYCVQMKYRNPLRVIKLVKERPMQFTSIQEAFSHEVQLQMALYGLSQENAETRIRRLNHYNDRT